MARPRDPFPALVRPLVDEPVQRALPPPPSRFHAVAGTWLMVAGTYGAHDVMTRHNIDVLGLVTTLTANPHAAAMALAAPAIWCGLALIGCFLVADGVPTERAPHAISGIFWLCCTIGGCTYALVAGAYIDDAPVASTYLRGFYLATLAASWMEFFLFTRCGWDLPRRLQPGERQAAGLARSATGSLTRARLAHAARRGRGGFVQPTAPGLL